MSESTLREIMRPAVIIADDVTFRDAVERMNKEKTNILLVVDSDGRLCGEVSVTELLGACVPETFDGDGVMDHFTDEKKFAEAVVASGDREVREFMSAVESVHADARLIDVAGTAIAMGQATIPVVDDEDHPIGIISRQGLKHILSKYLGIKEVQ